MEIRPPVCASIDPRLKAWAEEALPEVERQAIAAHLRACPDCRAAATAYDPTVLFLEARGDALPADFWAPFDAALRARLETEVRRPAAARLADRFAAAFAETRATLADAMRPAVWLAPAAAAMVVLVTLAVLRPTPPQIAQAPRLDGIPSPYAPPRARPDLPSGIAPGSGSVGEAPRPAGDTLPEPPTLEEVSSPSARVYRFDATGPDAPPIYFVVDESIEF
ncbi:MAG TPA: zf-HC2 domain-containing protein [Dongiaceae bacterium]|nr:zf-HC2 domain-containing protein [Dongiaceae bacterium]